MLSVQVREQLAAELAQAQRSRVPISPLTDANPDIDVVDAYEIQLINIRQRLAEGARVVGHKVGLSSEAMQKMMNVDEPDYGHLLDEMAVFEDIPVRSDRYLYPRVEVEGIGRTVGQRARDAVVDLLWGLRVAVDVDDDGDRAVEAGPEALGEEVVGAAARLRRRLCALVGGAEADESRRRREAEDGQRDDREDVDALIR